VFCEAALCVKNCSATNLVSSTQSWKIQYLDIGLSVIFLYLAEKEERPMDKTKHPLISTRHTEESLPGGLVTASFQQGETASDIPSRESLESLKVRIGKRIWFYFIMQS